MSSSSILGERGDTLVEVLIAMSIVAVVLGGAYLSSNKSLNTTQVAKERDIALRVAETQVERIRGFKTQSPNAPITNNSCMSTTTSNVANSGSLPALTADNLNSGGGFYNTTCAMNSAGASYASSPNGIPYYTDIEVSGNDYTVHVRWLRSGGGQNQETTLRYRYY